MTAVGAVSAHIPGAAKKRGPEAEDGSEKRQKFASGEDEIHVFPCSLVTTGFSSKARCFDCSLSSSPFSSSSNARLVAYSVIIVLPSVYSIPFSILFKAFSDIHISEDRQIAGIDKHMAPLLGSAFELWAQEGGVENDGVIFETCPGGPCSVSAYVAIREVKNEIGTAHTDSYSQASLIYRKLWAHSSREWMNSCL